MTSMSKTVQLDVVELLKQVLQLTPMYKPGLNKALLQAAKVGSVGCIKVLLSAGADTETEDDNGDTAFVHAFRGRHKEVMELLRDSGCNTEIAKMSLALATKDIQFVKFCQKLDIPIENEDWNTNSMEELGILLTELALDPFESTYGIGGFEGSPFLYLAQEGKAKALMVCMQKHPCLNKYTDHDRQQKIDLALFGAIRSHNIDNVKALVTDLSADINALDGRKRSALSVACEHDSPIAEYLIGQGADINMCDNLGLGPIHWSSFVGSTKTCQGLLRQGSLIDMQGDLGATPLMVACSRGHADVVKLLISAGADVNFCTPEGWSALHVAVQANNTGIVEQLLQAGAIPDKESSTLKQGDDTVCASTPLLIAISLDNIDIVHLLLEQNCNIDQPGLVTMNSAPSDDKQTPIEHAINTGQMDATCLLIRAGCNMKPIADWLLNSESNCFSPRATRDFEMMELLNRTVMIPPRLLVLTRKCVRDMLGYNIKEKLESMTLSNAVKQCILLKETSQPGQYMIM